MTAHGCYAKEKLPDTHQHVPMRSSPEAQTSTTIGLCNVNFAFRCNTTAPGHQGHDPPQLGRVLDVARHPQVV